MKGMPIRNCYYVLAQQLRGDIIRAPNTTKKFNELLFVFFIAKEGLPVWCRYCIATPDGFLNRQIHPKAITF
jgi:hypothetical protein